MGNKCYITIIGVIFLGFVIVFNLFPRSTFSELEKRDLTTFPCFSADSLASGKFTNGVSSWYSDTEPYRDFFMNLSMRTEDLMRLKLAVGDEENITFHAAEPEPKSEDPVSVETPSADVDTLQTEPEPEPEDDGIYKIAHAGIIVVGTGENVRAMTSYGGEPNGGKSYVNMVNEYHATFPDIAVYSMVIPTAIEFYCPKKVNETRKKELPTIEHINATLSDSVRKVNIFDILNENKDRNIYSRTDHHWAPLGAFIAAYQFSKDANVPFRKLATYERRVVKRFVGSMYGYSRDIAVKNAPEDFVYYVPRYVDYTTTYISYHTDKTTGALVESRPVEGQYFFHMKDGNGAAYCTFMGSDSRLTHVHTSTKNHRRLMIIKDSYGNALPSCLFYSFEDIHVVDFRYFKKNMVDYVRDNQITDILFALNIFNAYGNAFSKNCLNFLTQ